MLLRRIALSVDQNPSANHDQRRRRRGGLRTNRHNAQGKQQKHGSENFHSVFSSSILFSNPETLNPTSPAWRCARRALCPQQIPLDSLIALFLGPETERQRG